MKFKHSETKVSTSQNVSASRNAQGVLKVKLREELQKSITKNFEKRRLYTSFKDKISNVDLADMQLISKYKKGIRFLLCVIDIHSKYAWVVPLMDKKGITITYAFQKIIDESNRKPRKIWVDEDSEFCNRSIKSWL